MTTPAPIIHRGHCGCGQSNYRLLASPLFTHCCHCTWCQRETGSAFAINALIETCKVELESGNLEARTLQSNSGSGQEIVRCRSCQTVLWSHYSAAKQAIAFVRVGTLLDASSIKPDIHIFTESKLPWVQIPTDAQAVRQYYRRSKHWPEVSLRRYNECCEASL